MELFWIYITKPIVSQKTSAAEAEGQLSKSFGIGRLCSALVIVCLFGRSKIRIFTHGHWTVMMAKVGCFRNMISRKWEGKNIAKNEYKIYSLKSVLKFHVWNTEIYFFTILSCNHNIVRFKTKRPKQSVSF